MPEKNLRGFPMNFLADLNWRGPNYHQARMPKFLLYWLSSFFSPPTGTGNTVVIMVGYPKGIEILEPVRRGIPVKMTIVVGTRHVQEYISGQSVVFVAIAFITMMIISLAWLIFYYIQRFLYTGSQFGNQVIRDDNAWVFTVFSCQISCLTLLIYWSILEDLLFAPLVSVNATQ